MPPFAGMIERRASIRENQFECQLRNEQNTVIWLETSSHIGSMPLNTPVKLFRIFCILCAMATLSARSADNDIAALAREPHADRALDWLGKNLDWITEQQIRLTEIPAPEFSEGERGAAVKKLFESAGLKVRVDSTGNVIGERFGKDRNQVILLTAHMDTVFPAGTDVRVKRDGRRLRGPGIADNGAGLAALIGAARAMEAGKLQTGMTIAFAGDVGEEGEGNLRGIRALVEDFGTRLRAVIAVDGASTDYVTTQGLASRRIEATVTGPGGHSWSDFGAPNPITALSRGIVRFSSTSVPQSPRTSFNFGIIEGGTSVNSIPNRAAVKVDLRSEDDLELTKLEVTLRDAMLKTRRANAARSSSRSSSRCWASGRAASWQRIRRCSQRSRMSMRISAMRRGRSARLRMRIFRYRWESPRLQLAAAGKAAVRIRSTNGTIRPTASLD